MASREVMNSRRSAIAGCCKTTMGQYGPKARKLIGSLYRGVTTLLVLGELVLILPLKYNTYLSKRIPYDLNLIVTRRGFSSNKLELLELIQINSRGSSSSGSML